MAKWIEEGKKLLVEAGDTLSEIAQDFFGGVSNTDQLAALNGIQNKDLIYVDQTIDVSGNPSSSSGSGSGNQATINQFGIQSNSGGTLFATWTWNKSHTANYEVEWCYDTGDGVWFVGNKGTTEEKQSTYSIPSNAKVVRFRVKPVSETYTSESGSGKNKTSKTVSYWTASWSTAKTYDTTNLPPETPSTPSIEIEKYKLTVEIDNINAKDLHANGVQFQIVKDDKSVFNTGNATINTSTNHVSYTCTVNAGSEYKVRCRSYRGSIYSEWSQFSSNVRTIPATPSGITTCSARSKSSVYLEWAKEATAKTYDIEYATKKEYFDVTDKTTVKQDIENTYWLFEGLETGQEYFFRVRAKNDKGFSAWSDSKSVAIGKDPEAPTTWSSTTTVTTGEELTLYWIHNSKDNSSQTYAELEITIDGVSAVYTIKNTTDEDKKDLTSFYKIDTTAYMEGTQLKWRVRTAGVTNTYGEWSTERTVDVYAPPTLELSIKNSKDEDFTVLESFPFKVYALAGPSTQVPTGYVLTVISNEVYETVDRIGNPKIVNAGEFVYSKYFDIADALDVELSAGDLDLENNINYTISCTVSMNSGLTATTSIDFTVAWTDQIYSPNAEITYDNTTFVTHIKPYCEKIEFAYRRVNKSYNLYTLTEDIISHVYGSPLEDVFTETGEQVFYGTSGTGEYVYYAEVTTGTLVEDVTVAVYRREFDGTFTEIATGIDNTRNTFVTDPHPALDYARYRIVSIENSTGAVSFYDLPAFYIGEKAVIIQWDEDWTTFDVSPDEVLEQPAWSGSLLRLPYNIDVSDSYSQDVSHVNYIGRKHPVSYYGTQVGETSSWKVDIDKKDEETIYALRRLATWMGDAYVREPSGSGYWASVKVSFSQTHLVLTIPVTLDITRVEGGV